MDKDKTKRLYTDTTPERHKAVRIAAMEADQTMQEWLEQAVDERLARETKR